MEENAEASTQGGNVESTENTAAEATPSVGSEGSQSVHAEQQEGTNAEPSSEPGRPEWLLEKFNSPEDQAKSYAELHRHMGENFGAPKEEYTVDESLGLEGNDPILESMSPVFRDMGLSNKAFNKLAEGYMQAVDSLLEVKQQEMDMFREQNKHQVDHVQSYLSQALPKEQAAALFSTVTSPEAFKAIEMLVNQTVTNDVPGHDQRHNVETLASIESEKKDNWHRYKNDIEYRNDITRRERRARAAQEKRR